MNINAGAVEPVYNNHSRDQVIVVSVDRWSLYRGALVELKWTMSQPTVVSIDRWPFKTGFTVTYKCYFLQDFIYVNFVNELASINVI